VPLGEWLRLEVVCALGTGATGTYDLTIRLPGAKPTRFEKLSTGSPEFRRLRWLGFISLADETAVFYLDDLKLERDE